MKVIFISHMPILSKRLKKLDNGATTNLSL